MSFTRSKELLARVQDRTERETATHVLQIAETLPRRHVDQREETIAQIHSLSGRIDYVFDHDFGASLFEEAAEVATDPDTKKLLYRHAFYRASWCTQAATAGGEAICRAVDLNRIKTKLG